MEVVLFHIHPRDDVDEQAYQEGFEQMLALVSEMPGFVGIQGFAGEDGSELAVARFEDPAAIDAWREHPDHVRMRQRGREEFFAAYDITIATIWRHYDWARPPAAGGDPTRQLPTDPAAPVAP